MASNFEANFIDNPDDRVSMLERRQNEEQLQVDLAVSLANKVDCAKYKLEQLSEEHGRACQHYSVGGTDYLSSGMQYFVDAIKIQIGVRRLERLKSRSSLADMMTMAIHIVNQHYYTD